MMELQHPFPDSVRHVFLYVHSCFNCGRSDRGLELHHIFSRVSHSIYNAIPLCKDCHAKVRHDHEERVHFFMLTHDFLKSVEYSPSVMQRREDLRFVDMMEQYFFP